MTNSFEKKVEELKKNIEPLTQEERYNYLIALGRNLPPYPPEHKTPPKQVSGCQSTLYLHTEQREDNLFFYVYSDALISAGLAALLISVYNGESPATILKCPPLFLTELDLLASLSINRSNGLSSIHLRMKQEALSFALSNN